MLTNVNHIIFHNKLSASNFRNEHSSWAVYSMLASKTRGRTQPKNNTHFIFSKNYFNLVS